MFLCVSMCVCAQMSVKAYSFFKYKQKIIVHVDLLQYVSPGIPATSIIMLWANTKGRTEHGNLNH